MCSPKTYKNQHWLCKPSSMVMSVFVDLVLTNKKLLPSILQAPELELNLII
jgi:hypothetical protein